MSSPTEFIQTPSTKPGLKVNLSSTMNSALEDFIKIDSSDKLKPFSKSQARSFLKNLLNSESGEKKANMEDYIVLWKPFWLSDDLIPCLEIIEKMKKKMKKLLKI